MLQNLFRNHTSDVLWLIGVGIVALVVALILREVIARQEDARPDLATTLRKAQRALVTLVVVAAIRIGMFGLETSNERWAESVSHILSIALIVAVVWFICELIMATEELLLARSEESWKDDQVRVRKARTQIILLRRLLIATVIMIGVAAILMTFPAMRVIGQSVLASAGLVSIVAGLAAQTSLSNIIAGIQLALTDSIRVGDVVEAENESGTVAAITLTYVVIDLWNGRRMILPSTYFVTTPFQNWTRMGDRITGVVLMDVDWTVPIDDLRAELQQVLDESPLWDQRSFALVVGAVTQGNVTLRISTSAANTSDMFAINNLVRETVVTYLAARGEGVPRLRSVEMAESRPESAGIATNGEDEKVIPG